MTGEATDRSDLQKMQIGEATDLVARLREVDSGLSHAIWDRGCQSCALNSNTLNEAATLIEAQAAEIEEARRLLSESADLTSLCTTPERFGEAGSGEVFLRMTAHNAKVRALLTRPTTQEGPKP